MDCIKSWKPGLTPEEERDIAYWERNMLALHIAAQSGAGWYRHDEYPGWGRVISLGNGSLTFHVPDDFDILGLPEIENNWDGHTTEQKWEEIKKSAELWIEERCLESIHDN